MRYRAILCNTSLDPATKVAQCFSDNLEVLQKWSKKILDGVDRGKYPSAFVEIEEQKWERVTRVSLPPKEELVVNCT